MPLLQVLRPTLPILIGASIMLTLSMGLRQSLGIFLQPLTQDIHISVSDFTLALAVQNLAWGFLQPPIGGWRERYGTRLNSSHSQNSYPLSCVQKRTKAVAHAARADLTRGRTE